MSQNSHVNYLLIFIALCVLTALSVVSDVFRPSSQAVLIVIVLAIASAKAACVLMFFMHLKFEGNWKFVLLGPTAILAIGLPMALLPDIGMDYYIGLTPQQLAAEKEAAAGDSTEAPPADGDHPEH